MTVHQWGWPREMILTGDTYRLGQLPPHSIANVITEPGVLAEATRHLLERAAAHTRTVTAAQRRLFTLWLNNPLEAAVEHSTDEVAGTFEAQETRDQIARHHRRLRAAALNAADTGCTVRLGLAPDELTERPA